MHRQPLQDSGEKFQDGVFVRDEEKGWEVFLRLPYEDPNFTVNVSRRGELTPHGDGMGLRNGTEGKLFTSSS